MPKANTAVLVMLSRLKFKHSKPLQHQM